MLCLFGVFWSDAEFVAMAAKLHRPLSPERVLPELLARAVDERTVMSDVDVSRDRAVFFKHL